MMQRRPMLVVGAAVIFLSLAGFLEFTAGGIAQAATSQAARTDSVVSLTPARRGVSLNGKWQLTYGPIKDLGVLKQDLSQPPADFATIPATVPGNVELDLMAVCRLPDLYHGTNVHQALKLEANQWWYRRTFAAPVVPKGEKAELVFDGLDCVGTVWLNGKLAGRSANMLIPHRFDVTGLLRPESENEVLVRIDPAVLVARQTHHTPDQFNWPGHWERMTFVRKSEGQYGFDMSPRIISAGLWRDVRLEVTRPTHWQSVYWATKQVDRAKKTADLVLDWEFATEFVFLVNGEKIFMKGTNWIPLDTLHSHDRKLVEEVFPMVVDLNCNMVRCWGGNVYESDRFFDLCDENGVLVWQEFCLGNARYPQTEAFFATMREEAEGVVPRLRNHPCLALWCGSSECDGCYVGSHMDPNVENRLTRVVLSRAVHELDPYRVYHPDCPWMSTAVIDTAAATHRVWWDFMPEQHLWSRLYFKGHSYTETGSLFTDEIGYHGCPCRASLEQMFDPQFVYPWVKNHQWNEQWMFKGALKLYPTTANHVGFNDVMRNNVTGVFGEVPEKLDDFILASQATQAEANKFWMDFWRIGKGRRSGILIWNLRDCWPIASVSVVDYYNRKNLSYDYLRESQRDVQAICGEAEKGRHPLVIVNDTLKPVQGHVAVRRAGETAPLLEAKFKIDSNGKVKVGEMPQPKDSQMWQLEWKLDDGRQFKSHYLATKTVVKLDDYRMWMKQLGIRSP